MATTVRRVTVTDTATLIVSPNTKRQELILCNCSVITDIDIGKDSTLISGSALPLYANQTRERSRGFGTWLGPVYGIAASGQTAEIAVWETER